MQSKLFSLLIFLALVNNTLSQETSTYENNIHSLVHEVSNNPSVQVGNISPDSPPSLPIGIVKSIGGTIYCVVIDSAVFENDEAYFSAYMSIDFPGSSKKLAFSASHINFNPSGVLLGNGVKLKLVSDQLIPLGPKLDIFLKGDGSNYIEFDCNGYKQVHFNGEFRFKGGMLSPTTPGDTIVTANLDVTVQDLNNLYASITFKPFTIRGLDGYQFRVSKASVDFSDFENPSATLPASFTDALVGDQNLWRGFYLENLTVTLPDKFSKHTTNNSPPGSGTSGSDPNRAATNFSLPTSGNTSNSNSGTPVVTPTTFFANDLFIDNSGVTGVFGSTNILSLSQGDMSGWGFSVSQLRISMQSNTLVGGEMSGLIRIPVLDDTDLSYTASVQKVANNVNYNFAVGITNNMVMPISTLKSTFTVYNTSTLVVTDNTPSRKFTGLLTLNGKFTLDNTTAKLTGLTFQNLRIKSTKPYFEGGQFGLNGTLNAKFANFDVVVSNITLSANTLTKEIGFGANLGITFGENNTTFSANTGFKIYAKYEYSGSDGKHLKYDRFNVNNIQIDAVTTPFELHGLLVFKENDPVFGKLFYGEISFEVKKMTSAIVVRAGFGKIAGNSGYKYWYTDAQVPLNFPLGAIKLTQFIGGASYHVRQTQSNLELLTKANAPITPSLQIPFVPDQSIGLSVKAGVGFKHTGNEETINGEAVLGMTFFSSGGIQNVNFAGQAFMLVKKDERNNPTVKNKVHATVDINYDVEPKVFDATINGDLQFANAIDGTLNIKLHMDPTNWYIWFNRPSNRATLYIRKSNNTVLLSANAYLMFGTQIDPIPAMPSWAQNIGGANAARNINTSQASNGSGLVTGMQLHTGLNKEFYLGHVGNSDYYAYLGLTFDAGFDLMVTRYPDNARCGGNKFGLNQRYCQGNLYFQANASAGGKRIKNGEIKNSVNLFTINLAGLLQGKFPKPTYLSGTFAANVKFVGINLGSYNFNFDLGDNCTITY
jgi:hypothetical protein